MLTNGLTGTLKDGDHEPMNKAAQALGRMAKGKKKTLTKDEIKRRTKRLAKARKKRWPKKE